MTEKSSPTFSVALIGSTGGGTATLGHTNPPELLQTIHRELQKIENCQGISRALFVALEGGKGFDQVDHDENTSADFTATLYQIAPPTTTGCRVVHSGILKNVNAKCRELNQELATAISKGEIQGMICISISVEVFAETLRAASKANIPVTGTGGTSLSVASSQFQIRLVGNAGGSVANTSLTRAVSYTHALSTDWKTVYRPWAAQSTNSSTTTTSKAPSVRSVLNACLPVFWGVCLLKRILAGQQQQQPQQASIPVLLYALQHHALPAACAVVAATTTTTTTTTYDSSSRIMASGLASMVGSQSVLTGLLAGYWVRRVQETILFGCIVQNIPATMTNLVTTGGVGAGIALLLLPLAPLLRQFTSLVRSIILGSVTHPLLPSGVGAFAWGIFCCYGSKVGWYHAIFLPLILMEMEEGDASFLGALDELTLVLVCAGVCSGQWVVDQYLLPKRNWLSTADLALCQRAVRINLLYGDFVEACYPFMEQYRFVNVCCYLASGLSSALLVMLRQEEEVPKSLAYLPFPVSIWLAGNEWYPMFVASIVAYTIPFGATILNAMIIQPKR